MYCLCCESIVTFYFLNEKLDAPRICHQRGDRVFAVDDMGLL